MRLGYAVAAVLVAAAAAVWFGLPLGGALGQRFDAGASIDVRLDANRVYMIWTIGSTTPACDLRPVAETGPADVEFVVENDPGVDLGAAGRTWRGELLVRAAPAGTYRLTCDQAGAIGDPPWGFTGRARALTLVSALGLLLAGVAVAGLTARHSHRSVA